ncbi:MAG: heme-binding domain-containing protein [Opitutaceae bacterium]|nr:heme-binding domain-containing protein [Opitutaceae bacterium]MBP9913395.1 heme-binding domain-containing protein [Opitutaceae bacterium]
MKSLLKKILVVLFIALVAIQFFPAARNVSTAAPGPNDITVMYPTPPAVKAILAESCYDCHSDNTRYPWYTRIQPVGWWMQQHVTEGLDELNFSQFGTYTPKRARKKMDETIQETKDGEMPLPSYLIMHRQAKLTDLQIQQLVDWAAGIKASIPAP